MAKKRLSKTKVAVGLIVAAIVAALGMSKELIQTKCNEVASSQVRESKIKYEIFELKKEYKTLYTKEGEKEYVKKILGKEKELKDDEEKREKSEEELEAIRVLEKAIAGFEKIFLKEGFDVDKMYEGMFTYFEVQPGRDIQWNDPEVIMSSAKNAYEEYLKKEQKGYPPKEPAGSIIQRLNRGLQALKNRKENFESLYPAKKHKEEIDREIDILIEKVRILERINDPKLKEFINYVNQVIKQVRDLLPIIETYIPRYEEELQKINSQIEELKRIIAFFESRE